MDGWMKRKIIKWMDGERKYVYFYSGGRYVSVDYMRGRGDGSGCSLFINGEEIKVSLIFEVGE